MSRPGSAAHDAGRWIDGRLTRVEPDGSVTLHDRDGAARSLRPERVQVRRPGNRGRLTWQFVTDVATTWEQLELFAAGRSPSRAHDCVEPDTASGRYRGRP